MAMGQKNALGDHSFASVFMNLPNRFFWGAHRIFDPQPNSKRTCFVATQKPITNESVGPLKRRLNAAIEEVDLSQPLGTSGSTFVFFSMDQLMLLGPYETNLLVDVQ